MCVWHIRVIYPDDAEGIVDAALGGDREATLLLNSCGHVARQINTLTTPDPLALACLICHTPIWLGALPVAIVVVTEWDEVSAPDTHAICGDCFSRHQADRSALASAVLAGVGTRIAVPLRQLPPMVAAAGHA